MGANDSNGTATSDVLESLKTEREDLEKSIASVQQTTRDFDTLTERRKAFDAKQAATHLQLKGPHLQRCIWKGFITPEAFQWYKVAIARKKVLGDQLLRDTAAFGQALVRRAEDLDRRETQYRSALSPSASVPGDGQWTGEMAPSTAVLSGRSTTPRPDQFGARDTDKKVVNPPSEASNSSGDTSKSNSLLAKVLRALEEGGQHPTPTQLEDIGEACDAWQRYVVSHGVSPFVAGEQIQNIIRNFYNPGSGPNPGSEGLVGFQQGQSAGAGAGSIIGGAIVGISSSQKNSVWSMGPWPRGSEIDKRLSGNLPPGFPIVDRYENGVVTSNKSIDLNAPSYQNMRQLATTLESYADKVADFNGATRGTAEIKSTEITGRQLRIAIPPGSMSPAQKAVFSAAATEAQVKGVKIIVTEIH